MIIDMGTEVRVIVVYMASVDVGGSRLVWFESSRPNKSSLCYLYGISQSYAKMQVMFRCTRKNEIYLAKLPHSKLTNRFMG